jgi:hypothetical protein
MISAPSNIGRQSPLSPAGNLSPAARNRIIYHRWKRRMRSPTPAVLCFTICDAGCE